MLSPFIDQIHVTGANQYVSDLLSRVALPVIISITFFVQYILSFLLSFFLYRPRNVALIVPNMLALSGVIDNLDATATQLTEDQEKQANDIIEHELKVSVYFFAHCLFMTEHCAFPHFTTRHLLTPLVR